jgi:integrase
MSAASPVFLTAEELIRLTGYRQSAAQIRWLKKHRMRFFLQGPTEKPVVTRVEVERSKRTAQHVGPIWIRWMPRKLAPRVYWKHGAYWYVTPVARKWVRLGSTEREAFARLAEQEGVDGTMGGVIDRYCCEILPKKAKKTRHDQAAQAKTLKRSFGPMVPAELTANDVWKWYEKRAQAHVVSANRELSLLSDVLKHAAMWGDVKHDGAARIKRFKETKRRRYVTDQEFLRVYRMSPLPVRVAMRLARLTGQREGDILGLQKNQKTKDGLFFEQKKTGKRLVVQMTPSLDSAWRFAGRLPLYPNVSTIFVIHKRDGQRYTLDGFRAIWQRVQRRFKDSGGERFTFHDLRRKTGSEVADGKLLGHQDPRTLRTRYQVLPEKVKPLK